MLFLLVLSVLGGCGGGSASPPPAVLPAEENPVLPPDVPFGAYVYQDTFRPGAPVLEFGESVRVGADVAPPAEALSAAGARGGAALSRGNVRDGVSASDVVEYVRTAARHNTSARSVSGLATYPDTQTMVVSLAEGPHTRGGSTRFARLTRHAVAILNTALPFGRQIRFDAHLKPGNTSGSGISGEILVHFIPKTDPLYPEGADPLELGRGNPNYYVKDQTAPAWEVSESGILYSKVILDPELVGSLSDADVVTVLLHELLHAMGFASHTDSRRFDSVMNDVGFYHGIAPRALIFPIDREGLLAAYTRFRPGASPGEIDAESLGPWSETSFHLRGDLDTGAGGVAFGVAFRNGLPQPWAFGPKPATTLGDNPSLSGSVTWRGALVGVTPAGRGVVGDSSLTLRMEDFRGELAFTEMRFESGATWSDGDLRYVVRVEEPGDIFRRADSEYRTIELPGGRGTGYQWSGKELGTITGAFFGARHEGMGGVLERHDISAAFGGKR